MPRTITKRPPPESEGLKKIRTTKGLQTKLAKHLGISRQAVSDWDVVPIGRLLEVEEFTGISRAKLRPDIFARRKPKAQRRR